jgi:hypothetical protein
MVICSPASSAERIAEFVERHGCEFRHKSQFGNRKFSVKSIYKESFRLSLKIQKAICIILMQRLRLPYFEKKKSIYKEPVQKWH